MSITDALRLAKDALKEAGRIELYDQLLEIYEKDLTLQEENRTLKEEIRQLKEKLSINLSLRREGNHYISVDTSGNKSGGPFCSLCWDKDGLLIHQIVPNHWCPNCRNYGL